MDHLHKIVELIAEGKVKEDKELSFNWLKNNIILSKSIYNINGSKARSYFKNFYALNVFKLWVNLSPNRYSSVFKIESVIELIDPYEFLISLLDFGRIISKFRTRFELKDEIFEKEIFGWIFIVKLSNKTILIIN